MRRFLNIALAITMMMTTGSVATASEYHRINSHAARIKAKTKQLLRETRHYEHTDAYYQMVNDCRQMTDCAAVIRELARDEGCIFRLGAELQKLDRAFCHIQNLFDQTEINASYGHGCVKGNTRHVKRLLDAIQECIDCMREDVRVIRQRLQARPRPAVRPPVFHAPAAYPAPSYRPIRPVYGGYEYGSRNFNYSPRSYDLSPRTGYNFGTEFEHRGINIHGLDRYGSRGGISFSMGRGGGISFGF